MALSKPRQRAQPKRTKHKAVWKQFSEPRAAVAAAGVEYELSRFHCHGPNGEKPIKRKSKPSSSCPQGWKRDRALNALKAAIKAGTVSEKWNGDYPAFVWYRDGDGTVYEGAAKHATPFRYHGYPIEGFQVPRALRW